MSKAFTLIELVIVVAILAILAAVAVIAINPAEQMKAGRDSTRMSDFATIKSSIGLYLADGKTTMGSANTVYISIPDSSATCANLGLPALPGGWSYSCSTSDNYRKSNGSGWIPIDFTQVSFGNVLQTLPIDPVNATSTNNYYSFVTGGSYQLSTLFESSKYNSTLTSQYYTIGTNINLMPTLALVASSTGVTMNLSTVDGYAFITNSSLNLAPYLNKYIIVSDGTNNIQGFIKAQGSGETYGNELVVNGNMEVDSGWGVSGTPTTHEQSSEQAHAGTYSRKIAVDAIYEGTQQTANSFTTLTGALYLHSNWRYSANAASWNFNVRIGNNSDWNYFGAFNTAAGSWQQKTKYLNETVGGANARWLIQANNTASTVYIDDVSSKQVLSPSATGVTITNTRGGSTYNWVSDTGINPNASSFTVTISP